MKKFILFFLISLLLTGCSKEERLNQIFSTDSNIKEEISEKNKPNEDKIFDSTDNEKENKQDELTQDSKPEISIDEFSINDDKEGTFITNSSQEDIRENNEINYSASDNIVINSLKTVNQNVDNLLKEEKNEDTKSKLKGVFITLVDFVFYDGEIKGVTFNELTQEGKAEVLKMINIIDEKIENYFPGYKESISDKASKAYSKASEIIKNGANNIKEFAQEKLGEEYYQEIIAAKDELVLYTKNAFSLLGDFSSSLFNNVKDKLSNWYENFKNN